MPDSLTLNIISVVNMLQVRDYALLVSHNHPDGQVSAHPPTII